ncbi:hypothetical protein GUITHDRAFT_101217 [Guillardia theta CCMP2712]|uniref:Uncharacterized protein n=1 Tax=Guillardia theta (strain CCMP2712) TaxID=905079 RepID=L1JZI0_GUITC|nr:hypothetical protein GUITHDRAFT_101217 [Guillardia theta CCMP2712]EKX53518.1 hypothetical protein GUITHDRAFT_101217 [Guillardia theta CCMP2712]|eukprot:XP_005840498.1 hypothetical protein GUITHDRAFT_101217 [Guillardia theta CCMP2712]
MDSQTRELQQLVALWKHMKQIPRRQSERRLNAAKHMYMKTLDSQALCPQMRKAVLDSLKKDTYRRRTWHQFDMEGCELLQSMGPRHICAKGCYFLHYAPAREAARLRRWVEAQGGSQSLLNGWYAKMERAGCVMPS